jgi:hypothetical protein
MPYTLDGAPALIGTEPQRRDGVDYLPLRDLAQELGGSMSWSARRKEASVTLGPWTAALRPGEPTVDREGAGHELEAPPFIDENGDVWVPEGFFREVFGYEVRVDGDQVTLTSPLTQVA